MSAGGWAMAGVIVITVLTLGFLLGSMARNIRNERSPHRSIAREFGLGLVLVALFAISWIGQAITQWQTFTDQQLAQGQRPQFGDFLTEFGMSTFENWQSEFLQLFSFVVLAALYIYKGSAESKDGEEELQASLLRIETHLGTLPADAPTDPGEEWKLPDTALSARDRVRLHS